MVISLANQHRMNNVQIEIRFLNAFISFLCNTKGNLQNLQTCLILVIHNNDNFSQALKSRIDTRIQCTK